MANETLGLFGMSWVRNGDEFRPSVASVPVQPGSRLALRNETGNVARLDVRLVVDWGVAVAGGGRFEIDATVALARAGDTWQVAASSPPALRRVRIGRGDLPADRLRIELGPVQHATSEAELRVIGGDVAVATRDNLSSATVWLQDLGTDRHEMPVKVRTDRVVATLDLPGATVTFAPGSFAATVTAPYETRADDGVVDIRPVYVSSWSSTSWSASLSPVPANAALAFLPDPDASDPVRLFLNGELKSRPALFGSGPDGGNLMLPALEATEVRLVFDFNANAAAPRRPLLSGLRLLPADTASGAAFRPDLLGGRR